MPDNPDAHESEPISADVIARARTGAQAIYDDACVTLYRTREGADEKQIREWQDAELRAERHEALLDLLGPEEADISRTLDVTGRHSQAVCEALARYGRDFPGDPLRDRIKALRRAAGETTKGRREKVSR